MKWLNFEVKTFRSTEFLGSEPTERATWIALLAYCADHENGGTIPSCRDWKDRRWQQLVGVTKAEVEAETELWQWVIPATAGNRNPRKVYRGQTWRTRRHESRPNSYAKS
jgi:hypothetical protein